jgi:hypothetical protein
VALLQGMTVRAAHCTFTMQGSKAVLPVLLAALLPRLLLGVRQDTTLWNHHGALQPARVQLRVVVLLQRTAAISY